MVTNEVARLLALLRILERCPSEYGVVGDDAVLDAWFGARSPVIPPPACAIRLRRSFAVPGLRYRWWDDC